MDLLGFRLVERESGPGLDSLRARTLLTAVGPDVADIRTSWATKAGDLIEISITLQRPPETRDAGLAIFEALLDIGAYEASQVLRELDRRPV